MVCALRFERGRVCFTNRFVRSHKFVAEETAGRPIFRTFGTAFEADQIKRGIALESPVNVSVYPYGGRLLAFGEQGLPWELDPLTLETRGVFTFGDRLNDVSPFSAHPKFDPATGEMFNFGVSFSATQPRLNVYRFGAHATAALSQAPATRLSLLGTRFQPEPKLCRLLPEPVHSGHGNLDTARVKP